MISIIKYAYLIAIKDLTIELKTKQTIISMIIFAAIVIVTFGFAFEPTNNNVKNLIPGLIWIIIYFGGILGINRSFSNEHNNNTLAALIISPIPSTSIYLGKLAANFLFICFFELITIPFLFLMFDFKFNGNLSFFLITLLLGTLGFVIVGTFFSGFTASFKNSDMLFQIMLFSLIIPIIIASVQATKILLVDFNDLANAIAWIKFISIYDLVFLVLSLLLFEYVLEV